MTIQFPASTLAIAAALVLCVAAPAAFSQTTPAKPAAAKKPAPAKTSKKSPPPPKVVAEPPPPEAAGPEQIEAAEQVYYGIYECEFKQTINIIASPKFPSYVDVKHAKSEYLMKPVLSSTGAIRLEDVRGEMLMVQVSSKSMVLNVKTGQRVVDDCISPKQRELVEAARVKAAAAVQAAAASAAQAASAPAPVAATSPAPASTPAASESTAPMAASAPAMTTTPAPLPTK